MSLLAFTNNQEPSGGGGGGPSPLVIVQQPANVSGTRSGYGTIRTIPTTMQAAGGTPPYTYSWIYQSGNPDILPAEPSKSTTRFFVFADGLPFYDSAVYRGRVTDSATVPQVVDTNVFLVECQAENIDGGQLQ